MFRTFIMMLAGFIIGLILSENAQLIQHSVPAGKSTSGNVNQFVLILGVGNSGNTFEINTGDDTNVIEESDEVEEISEDE